jgi:hypothetical protein
MRRVEETVTGAAVDVPQPRALHPELAAVEE